MNRERVIVDIENVDQALKVEQTIKTGYCDPVAESITQWIAVEEDLAVSYNKIASNSTSSELKEALRQLEEESRQNIDRLHSLLKSVEDLSEARVKREILVKHFIESK